MKTLVVACLMIALSAGAAQARHLPDTEDPAPYNRHGCMELPPVNPAARLFWCSQLAPVPPLPFPPWTPYPPYYPYPLVSEFSNGPGPLPPRPSPPPPPQPGLPCYYGVPGGGARVICP